MKADAIGFVILRWIHIPDTGIWIQKYVEVIDDLRDHLGILDFGSAEITFVGLCEPAALFAGHASPVVARGASLLRQGTLDHGSTCDR